MISDKAKVCPKCGAPNIPDSGLHQEERTTQTEETLYSNHTEAPQPEETEYNPVPEPDNYDWEPEPPKSRRKLFLIIIFICAVIVGAVGYFFFSQHQKQKAAQAEADRIEQLRLDSLEAIRLEAERIENARLDSIRQDSIKRAEFLKNFTCDIFIRRVNENGYPNTRENSNWGNRLVELGFVKGKRKMTYQGPGEYDGETQTTYTTKYTYGEGKDKITVSEYEDDFGEISESGWNITFSTSEQLESFVKSLKNMGYKNFQKMNGNEYSSTIGNNICVYYIWWIDRRKNTIHTTNSQC